MSVARGGDNNGNNDDHSIAVAALTEYPNLWPGNQYGGRQDGSTLLLELSPCQYASLFNDLPLAGGGLYHGSGCSDNRLQDGHRALTGAMNAVLQGSSVLCNNQHKRKEVKWWHDSLPGGVSSAMVRMEVTLQHSTQKRGSKDALIILVGSGGAMATKIYFGIFFLQIAYFN
jgi:hypothetical protein